MIGYHYFRNNGFLWRKHLGALMPLSMPHRNPGLRQSQAMALLAKHFAYLIRWESDFDSDTRTEWWHVIKSEPEELQHLSANTRSKVRRGERQFLIEPVIRDVILEEGHAVYCKAYQRYDTFESMMSRPDFVRAILDLPTETEFWAVRDRKSGKMEAFSENLVMDGACFYLSIWVTPDSLKRYASYALIHHMNRHYLNVRGLAYVSDGARNISHETGIHDFLIERFGFRRAYARLHIAYFPLLTPVIHALFPFRRRIGQARGKVWKKITVLLEQEAIRRSFRIHRDTRTVTG
ncbi:hypothetical protein [Billgrantia saliphila]|uniref:hypothetical protein n=1 Tax=Billgrantia saliphila TaxID=1848458 RepID=UPI000CE2C082|nr:hypothetical protein [Halomonas saliphila]